MTGSISNFIYTRQNYEGELKYVIRFIINCYQLIVANQSLVFNHEEKITAHLVEDYLKNRSIQRENEFEGYLFDREPSAGVKEDYSDIGYLDIKVSMQHTFEDPHAVFIIECKRLDGSKPLNREYIAEGMMRFITKKYPTKLGANALIGFCTKDFDCEKNITKINKLIKDEFLNSNTTQFITSYQISPSISTTYSSEHHIDLKDANSKISLYHVILNYSSLLKVNEEN